MPGIASMHHEHQCKVWCQNPMIKETVLQNKNKQQKICQGKDLIAHMKKKKILKSRRRKLKVEHVPQWWRKAITYLNIENFWDKGKKNKESQQTIKWFHQLASGKNYIHISKMWKQLKLKVRFCKLTTLKVKEDCAEFWNEEDIQPWRQKMTAHYL